MKRTKKLAGIAGLMLLCLHACQQRPTTQENNSAAPAYKNYTSQPVTVTLRGNLSFGDSLQFRVQDPHDPDFIHISQIPTGEFEVRIKNLNKNEVYELQVWSKNKGESKFYFPEYEEIFFVANDKNPLTITGGAYPALDSQSDWRFYLDAQDADHRLLNEYRNEILERWKDISGQVARKVDLGRSNVRVKVPTIGEAIPKISGELIDRKEPTIATMYLIYHLNDHAQQKELYGEIYENADTDAQNSKYGVDLYNKLLKLDNMPKNLDMEKELASRNTQLLPFVPANYEQEERLLLVFWSAADLHSLQMAQATDEWMKSQSPSPITVLYFSLDHRMSQWQAASRGLELEHNFMIRTEARQPLIDKHYISHLPRAILITQSGEILDNDVDLENLSAVFD